MKQYSNKKGKKVQHKRYDSLNPGSPESDKLKLPTKELHQQKENKKLERLTKRSVLSRVAATFDRVGFASAFVIRAKICLQDFWKRGLDWDDELPHDMQEFWTSLFNEALLLSQLEFERCLTPASAIEHPILCTFADASTEAFGTFSYVRHAGPFLRDWF